MLGHSVWRRQAGDKAISSRLKEPRDQSVWLGADISNSLELSLGRKVRFEASTFQEGSI